MTTGNSVTGVSKETDTLKAMSATGSCVFIRSETGCKIFSIASAKEKLADYWRNHCRFALEKHNA
jgi:uncharacterized membrane protein